MASTICIILFCIAIIINAWGIYDLSKKYREFHKELLSMDIRLFGLYYKVINLDGKKISKKKGKK